MDEAYSYLRWSTPDQSWGDSDRRQLSWAESWCEQNGCVLAEVYRDSGVSAFRGKNRSQGSLGDFLAAVKSGTIRPKYLIVENLDRLSRNDPDEAFDLLREIVRSGITLVTRNQVYSTQEFRKNPYILQQALGEMIRAHAESQRKSEMLIEAHEQKRRLARERKVPITSKVPTWLRLEGEGKREDKKWVLVPEIAAVVERIFDESIAGIGLWKIARRLNEDGVPPFKGKNGWHKSSVFSVLSNRSVMGYFQPHKMIDGKRVKEGEEIADFYPAIIDERRFAQAQVAMAGRYQSGGNTGLTYTNLVSRLGICEVCGDKLILINRGKRDHNKSLACSGRIRGNCTNKSWFPYRPLERMLLALHDLTNAVASVVPVSAPANSASATLAQLTADIEIAKHKLNQLLAQFGNHEIVAIRDAAKGQIENLGATIQRMERQKDELRLLVKATDRVSEQSLLTRVQEAKKQVSTEDEVTRLMARATVTQEFRRVITRLVLHETADPGKNHWLTVHIKGHTDGTQVEYDLRPEGVNSIRTVRQQAHRSMVDDRPRIKLVGPDGQTVSVGEDARKMVDILDDLSEQDKWLMALLGEEVNGWKLVYTDKIDPIEHPPEDDCEETEDAAE